MALDTEAKRWGMMQWACGPSYYPTIFNPDTSGLSAIERATVLKLYGGIAWDSPAAGITVAGVEWTLDDGRAHFALPRSETRWTLPDSNAHWTIPEQ